MKKFYSLLLFVLAAATSAFAGPISSTATGGNWNATTTWVGGVVPASGDDVYIVPGATVTVTADATINSITFTNTAITAKTLTVNSGVTLTVTGAVTVQNGTGGNTSATVAGAGTITCASFTVGGTSIPLTASATSTLTFTLANLSVSGNLSAVGISNSGRSNGVTFNLQSGKISVGGSVVLNEPAGTVNFTMASGAQTGTLDIAGSPAFSTTGAPTFTANATSSTVIYSGAAQTVNPVTYRNLTLSGSGTKTMTAVGTVNGNMILSGTTDATTAAAFSIGGTLNVGSGTTLTAAAFNFSVTGTTTIDGTLVSNSTTGTKTFDNIIINNGGLFNSSANENYSLTGGLQVNGTGSITSGTGTWTFSGTGTPALDGTGSASITTAVFSTSYNNSGTFSFANLDISGAGTVNLTNNKIITVSTALTGSDNLVQGTNGLLNFGGASIAVTGFTTTASGNTVNYTAAAQTIRGVAYQNLTLSGSNTKTLGANTTVNATLSMQGTAALSVGAFALTYGASSTLEYAGSASQTTTSVEFKTPGGPTNLTINNTNGVTLHAARTIAGVVTFTGGVLTTTAANLLTVSSTGSVSGASDASFVDGPVKKVGAIGGTAFDFPVGKTGVGYMKISIANVTGATTEFTAQYLRASAATTFGSAGLSGLGLQAVSNCEYWTLDRAVTSSNADVTLSWNSHSPCGSGSYLVDPLFGIRVVHYNTSTLQWDAHGGGSPSGDASAGSVTWTGVSNFSPFALGALIGSQSGLPVMFSDVKAYEKNRGVQIEWSNLTERDLVNYIVERSSNGVNFTVIGQQQPRSNNNDKESYSAFDAAPLSGANFYRVKVLEISGKVIYSKVIRVDIGRTMQGFTLYPNPVKGNQVSVSINTKQGQYTLKVLNTSGQEIYSQRIVHQGGSLTQVVELPSAIKPGVYNMLISGGDYREAKMFVVQ